MIEPKWLTVPMILAMQEECIVMFGGLAGVRDLGLLESAIARPKHLFAYQENLSIFDLAASLCVAIIRNHPFLDPLLIKLRDLSYFSTYFGCT
ncbi:MAG: death-on-curing family protein [bacterium]|nr:MAG: death-on-curing family protein [bacterium]